MIVNARFLTQPVTGVQRYAIEISKQLKQLCRDIRFVAPRNIIHKELAEELEVECFGPMTGHLWEQVHLLRYMRRKNNNNLLLNLANTAPIGYSNQIVTIHDVCFLRHPEWFSRRFNSAYRFLVPRIARKCQHVITDSDFSKREIIETINIDPAKIQVVSNAVSPMFHASDNSDYAHRFKPYVLAVSSLAPSKNLRRMVQAFLGLNRQDLRLVLVGATNRHYSDTKLSRVLGKDNRVVLVGYVNDRQLVSLYRNAEFFVYPSLYEGFGLPPLEAMQCGCPVIVSKAASLKEVCGDAAYYVNPLDTNDIRTAINKFLVHADLREHFRNAGFNRARHFNWKNSAQKLLSIVETVNGR